MWKLKRARRGQVVGLDIEHHGIRVAVLGIRGGRPCILKLADSSIPVSEPRALAAALSDLFDREHIPKGPVIAGVGGRGVLTKVLQMERMTDAEARAVIPWEAEQHVPFDMTRVYLDFDICDRNDSAPQMTVLLAVARRETIESRLALLSEAGLKVSGLGVRAVALLTALEANYPQESGQTAILSLHQEESLLVRVDGRIPVDVQDLGDLSDLGREQLESLARLVEDEASGSSLVPFADDVARLFICGRGALGAGTSGCLADRLGFEVRTATPLNRLAAAAAVVDRLAEGDGAQWMSAVGLALGHMGSAADRLPSVGSAATPDSPFKAMRGART